MIPRISLFATNSQVASSIAFVALSVLVTSGHASAQSFVDPLQNCRVRKAYAVTAKLLAVYISHILTIKVEPGLGLRDTIRQYVAAALLPSSSAHVPISDFMFLWKRPLSCRANKILNDMQKAINCGAVCVRVKRTQIPPAARVIDTSYSVRGKPLEDDEKFILVPRGIHADLFVPTMIQSRSSIMKVIIGGAQIYFATLQLVSATDPQIAAYGYGAFIYTIIPYALGSFINLISLLLTGDYIDLTEMELAADSETDTIQRSPDNITEIEADSIKWNSSDLKVDVLFLAGFLEFAIYLAVVGGITHFRPGISSSAQRGWFMSWALCGTIYGYVARPIPSDPGKRSVNALLSTMKKARKLQRRAANLTRRAGKLMRNRDESESAHGTMDTAEKVGDRLPMAQTADSTIPISQPTDSTIPISQPTDSTIPISQMTNSTMSISQTTDSALPRAQPAGSTMVMAEMAKDYVEYLEKPEKAPIIVIGIGGAATIGGVVTMVQQYMSLIHC